MTVAVDGKALRASEGTRAVAGTAKHADEVAIGIENLDAVVQGVGHIDVSVGIDGDVGGPRKRPGILIANFSGRTPDSSQQLEAVSVEYCNVVLHDIGHIQKSVPGIHRNAAGTLQRLLAEAPDEAMRSVEHEHSAQVGIAHKEAVVLVDGQTDDLLEVNFFPVVNELYFVTLGVEDKYRAHVGVGHIDPALGVRSYAVRLNQDMRGNGADFVYLLHPGQAIHPALFLLDGLNWLGGVCDDEPAEFESLVAIEPVGAPA